MVNYSGCPVPRAPNAAPSTVKEPCCKWNVEKSFQCCAHRVHQFPTSHSPTTPLLSKSPSKLEHSQLPDIETSTPGNSSDSAMPQSQHGSLIRLHSPALDRSTHYHMQKIVSNMLGRFRKEE